MDSRLRGNDKKKRKLQKRDGNDKKERDCHVGRNSGFSSLLATMFLLLLPQNRYRFGDD